MLVTAIKTSVIGTNSASIFEVLEQALPKLIDGSIVAVTSKIVSICEGSVLSTDVIDKEDLIIQESHLYLPASLSKYNHHFTVTNNTLIPVAGIDESNGEGYYILWPKDAQATANAIREWLKDTYNLDDVGVVITDSTCRPLRRGTTGIALAHSGFLALNNYIGEPDLYGRPFGVTQANIAEGIAAAAVVAMGEGAEQTPLCVVSDLPMVEFSSVNPSAAELSETTIDLEDDLFAPFLTSVDWQIGNRGKRS